MFRERLVAASMPRIQKQHTNGQDRKPSWSQFYHGGCGLQDRESVERGDRTVSADIGVRPRVAGITRGGTAGLRSGAQSRRRWGLLDGSVEPSSDPAHTDSTQQANKSDDPYRGEY